MLPVRVLIAGTVAVTLAVVVLISIPPTRPTRPARLVSLEDVDAGKAAFAHIVDQVYGPPDQRAAGEEIAYLTAQAAIADCAAQAGVFYAVTPFVPATNPTSPVAPGDLIGFAPLRIQFGVATRIVRLAAYGSPVNPGLAQATTAAAKATYFATVERCQSAASAGDRLAVPDGQEALEGRFVEALTRWQDFLMGGAEDDYRRCMAYRGIRTIDLADLYVQVESRYPPVSYDTPSNPALLPGWADAWAFETQAAQADASCRDGWVDMAMATVPNALRDFERDNAAALASVATGWRGMPATVSFLRATVRVTH